MERAWSICRALPVRICSGLSQHAKPPSAESLDQDDGRDHALASNLGGGPLVREKRRLRVDDIEVTYQAGPVPV